MAEDGSKQSESVWPLPKFRFEVRFGHVAVAFQEVSGLDVESQPIEYRGGSGAAFSTVKMPGIKKYGNITLKKGVFPKDGEFWAWYVGLVRPCWCAISAPYDVASSLRTHPHPNPSPNGEGVFVIRALVRNSAPYGSVGASAIRARPQLI